MDKHTPLFEVHEALGATMVPFGGFVMPIQYPKGILTEHKAVREKAGLFDVSHMGELTLSGPDALANLNRLISNDFTDLEIGKIRYGILVRDNGTAVDDLLVYKRNADDYLIVVNASNTDKDDEYFQANLKGEYAYANVSSAFGQIALQGPMAEFILRLLTDQIPQAYYSFIDNVDLKGIPTLISRTGYTGEDGFELYCASEHTVALWNAVVEVGSPFGLEPCGLGARDTLRLEAGMPLYGHELDDETTPIEAGLKFFTKLDKPDFIAQDALSLAPKKRRIGLRLIDRGIAREGSELYFNGQPVGRVTSGTMSPTLGVAIAMGYVSPDVFTESQFEIDVRGRRLKAEKVKLPFYKK
jgi:aminomethyltransferase